MGIKLLYAASEVCIIQSEIAFFFPLSLSFLVEEASIAPFFQTYYSLAEVLGSQKKKREKNH